MCLLRRKNIAAVDAIKSYQFSKCHKPVFILLRQSIRSSEDGDGEA